jgi:septal ring factor EnvC (AmiA/AmiB activator)
VGGIVTAIESITPAAAALVSAFLTFIVGFLAVRTTANRNRTDALSASAVAMGKFTDNLQEQVDRSDRTVEALTRRVADLEEVRSSLRDSVDRLEAQVRQLTEERDHLAILVTKLERNIKVLQAKDEPGGRRLGPPKPVDDS